MALLRCIDCGGKVSDKAFACPHCGCPIEFIKQNQNTTFVCDIKGHTIDFTDAYTKILAGDKLGCKRAIELALRNVVDTTSISFGILKLIEQQSAEQIFDGLAIMDYIKQKELDSENKRVQENMLRTEFQKTHSATQPTHSTDTPKCPTCGSANLTKIGAGSRALDGFFFGRHSVEGRAQWRCMGCGYLW